MKLYKNKNWLYQKYIKEKLPASWIAKLIGCGRSTIGRWLKKYNIPIRTKSEVLYEEYRKGNRICFFRGKTSWNKGKHGKESAGWKGGQIIDSKGYILMWMPDHPNADGQGYVRRSHLVAEKTLGRYLFPNEITHHKNKTKADDKPENIKITTRERHMDFHRSANGRLWE